MAGFFRMCTIAAVIASTVAPANITSDLDAVPLTQFNPEMDLPAVLITCCALFAGLLNILTFLVFIWGEELRKNPLNYMVVVMAGYDLILCIFLSPIELINSPAVTSLVGLSLPTCVLRMTLRGICVHGNIVLLGALSLLRLYGVIKRHRQTPIPKAAVYVAIAISVTVATARATLNFIVLAVAPQSMALLRACMGMWTDPEETSNIVKVDVIIFLIILTCLGSYFVQYVMLRHNLPRAPSSSVGPATANVFSMWEISSARVGVMAVLAFLVYYLPSVVSSAGYRPPPHKFFSYISLAGSLVFIQGFVNPCVYMLTTPLYRETLKRICPAWLGRNCVQPSVESAPEEISVVSMESTSRQA